ncbi:MAG TPA: class I SAM-dependent methyltransferase [Vicinamibacterales bacterium]
MAGLNLGVARFIGNLFGRPASRPAPPREKPKGWLSEEEDSLVPPRSVWIGPDDPISHYYRWVWEYLAYLTLVAELGRQESVLELGCGHGRTSRGLLCYLRAPGSYAGLDVDRVRVEDAKARIEARWPNFRYVWADVRSSNYNPSGAVNAANYRFPFDDAAFDVLYAASLFTHLLPAETANYLRESRRVMKPGGRCLFSVFLLDHYRGPKTTISPMYEFEHRLEGHPGVATRDPRFPDAAVAYNLETLTRMADSAGLRVDRVLPGLWSESPGIAVNEQDMVLLRARD